ncbi:MAG TPA: hypothetical protein VFU11_09700, partial [Solirubrobacterales bacterium]|nr:hypothetical protein [Solirubrobacterales bacterium]
MAENTEAAEDSGYKLLLTGDGISIDRKLDSPTALAVVELVMGGPAAKPAVRPASGRSGTTRRRKNMESKKGGAPRKARSRTGSPSMVRELSLRPKGKQGFMEFVEEKQPRNHFEKQAVAVCWLARIAGMQEGITVDHVN